MNEKNAVRGELKSVGFPKQVRSDVVEVTTSLGVLPESDIEVIVVPQESDPLVWTIAVEGRYKGTDPKFAKHVGEIVRRDVWNSIKCGHAMTGKQG